MNAKLVFIVGASGTGKDSLIGYARQQLDGVPGLLFAHRYITRPLEAGGENHVALSPAEFQLRRQAGLFVMHWHSHGLDYGIGIEVALWLERGHGVVVNGSRAYLPQARALYPDLLPIWIQASPAIRRQRLLARGRETLDQIEQRLAAPAPLANAALEAGGVHINNDGSLETAGEQLIAAIGRYQASEIGPSACPP